LPHWVRVQRNHTTAVGACADGRERVVKRNAGCSQTWGRVTVGIGESLGDAKADATDAKAVAAANLAFLEDARVGDSAGVRFFTTTLPVSVPSIRSL
jgi:hypothetical protein